MSMIPDIFKELTNSEIFEILSYLKLSELYNLGNVSRYCYILFIREKDFRINKYNYYEYYNNLRIPINKLNEEELLQYNNNNNNNNNLSLLISSISRYPKLNPGLNNNINQTLLASYPRSGNSLLRKLLETSTGYISGSDTRPYLSLSSDLIKCGYYGEGILNHSALLIKSHYPERLGFFKREIKKCIVIIRNPFDTLDSYFHMSCLLDHKKIMKDNEFYGRFYNIWKEFLRNEIKVWKDYINYWINEKKLNKNIIFVRYEDVVKEQEKYSSILSEFAFLGDENNPSIKLHRLQYKPNNDIQNKLGYDPKKGSNSKSLRRYTEDDIKFILEEVKDLITELGYELVLKNDNLLNDDQKNDIKNKFYPNLTFANEIYQLNILNIENYSLFTSSSLLSSNYLLKSNMIEINNPLKSIRINDNAKKFGRNFALYINEITNNGKNKIQHE